MLEAVRCTNLTEAIATFRRETRFETSAGNANKALRMGGDA